MMRSPKVSGANLPTSSRWPGDSIWKQPRVWVERMSAKVGGVVERARRRGRAARRAVDPLDLVEGVGHRRLHPDAEHVELEQAELLDVVLVELAHREAQPAGLDRGAVEQRGVGEQHAARVQRDVAGQAVEALDQGRGSGRAARRAPSRPRDRPSCAARAGRAARPARRGRGCAGRPWRRRRSRRAAGRGRRRRRASRAAPGRCRSSTRRRSGRRRSGRGSARRSPCAAPTRRRRRCRAAPGAAATGSAP